MRWNHNIKELFKTKHLEKYQSKPATIFRGKRIKWVFSQATSTISNALSSMLFILALLAGVLAAQMTASRSQDSCWYSLQHAQGDGGIADMRADSYNHYKVAKRRPSGSWSGPLLGDLKETSVIPVPHAKIQSFYPWTPFDHSVYWHLMTTRPLYHLWPEWKTSNHLWTAQPYPSPKLAQVPRAGYQVSRTSHKIVKIVALRNKPLRYISFRVQSY